jgi:hypothetical protein
VELSHRYDDAIPPGQSGFVDFQVVSAMKAPVYVYYELSNFYQNHRRYVKSRDDDQLAAGNSVKTGASAYSANCDPRSTSSYTAPDGTVTEKQLYPCGLVALSVFNDTFVLSHNRNGSPAPYEYIDVDQTPDTICWPQDVSKKFHQANPAFVSSDSGKTLLDQMDMWLLKTFPPQVCLPVSTSTSPVLRPVATKQLPDGSSVVDCDFSNPGSITCNFDPPCTGDFAPVTNPSDWGVNNGHFINWMRTAGLSTFRKLYGRINIDLEPGDTVRVAVQSNFPVESYSGTKSVVLSTVSWLGGKNSFLGIGYLAVGGVALIFTAVYAFLHFKRPRRLVDIDYLDWGDNR